MNEDPTPDSELDDDELEKRLGDVLRRGDGK